MHRPTARLDVPVQVAEYEFVRLWIMEQGTEMLVAQRLRARFLTAIPNPRWDGTTYARA